jgi:hypothetical protein
VAEATTAATLASEGATVAEAVSSATSGAVQTSALTEVASTATEAITNAWETLSQAAQNITSTIGETLVPGVDPTIQKLTGQVAVNTVTNGGNFEKALVNTGLSFGSGWLGSEVSDITGSNLAGFAAANSAKQLATTGNVNLTNLAGSVLGREIGQDVANTTGSDFLGKAASSITNSAVQGKNAANGLIGLGVNALVNDGPDILNSFTKSADVDSAITGEDQSGVQKTGTTENGLNAVAENDNENINEVSGGLNQVSDVAASSSYNIAPEQPQDITESNASSAPENILAENITEAPAGGLNQVFSAEQPASVEPPPNRGKPRYWQSSNSV